MNKDEIFKLLVDYTKFYNSINEWTTSDMTIMKDVDRFFYTPEAKEYIRPPVPSAPDNGEASKYCIGEKCHCGRVATHKIEEVIFDDMQPRHPYTQYVCNEHFNSVMNPSTTPSVGKSEGEEAMTEQKFLEKWATDSDYHNGCPAMKKDLQSLYSSLLHSSGDRGRKEWPTKEEISDLAWDYRTANKKGEESYVDYYNGYYQAVEDIRNRGKSRIEGEEREADK